MASAGGTKLQTLTYTCSSCFFLCSAVTILSFFLRIRGQHKADITGVQPKPVHASCRVGSKVQPGARNSQPARAAPLLKQKWDWDQNSLPQLNRPHAEKFLLLPERWSHHPNVCYCNWAMTFPSPEQSKLQYFTPKFPPLLSSSYCPFPPAHCCRFPNQLLSGKTRKHLGHTENKVALV